MNSRTESIREEEEWKEIQKWNMSDYTLRPALVTREDLWKDFMEEDPNWIDKVLELGASVASFVLGGAFPDALELIRGAVDIKNSTVGDIVDPIKGSIKAKLSDRAVEHASGRVVGAYMTNSVGRKDFKYAANKRFATKLLGKFLTILIAAAGGALTVSTGVGALIGAGIATVIWLGDIGKAEREKRCTEIVDSMMIKYNDIRDKKELQGQKKQYLQCVQMIRSNEKHDLEDEGKIKYYSNGHGSSITITTDELNILRSAIKDAEPGKEKRVVEAATNKDIAQFCMSNRDICRSLWGMTLETSKPPQTKEQEDQQKKALKNFTIDAGVQSWIRVFLECLDIKAGLMKQPKFSAAYSLPVSQDKKFMASLAGSKK